VFHEAPQITQPAIEPIQPTAVDQRAPTSPSYNSPNIQSRYITGDFNEPAAFGVADDGVLKTDQTPTAGQLGNGNGESSFVYVVRGPVVAIDAKKGMAVIKDSVSHKKHTIFLDSALLSRLKKGSVIQTTLRPGSSKAENVKQIAW
jgi:hypothetical protein